MTLPISLPYLAPSFQITKGQTLGYPDKQGDTHSSLFAQTASDEEKGFL